MILFLFHVRRHGSEPIAWRGALAAVSRLRHGHPRPQNLHRRQVGRPPCLSFALLPLALTLIAPAAVFLAHLLLVLLALVLLLLLGLLLHCHKPRPGVRADEGHGARRRARDSLFARENDEKR